MKFGYLIIYVPNVHETIKFYESAFKLSIKFIHEEGSYGELDTGDTILAFASESVRDMNSIKATDNRTTELPAGAEIGLVTDDVQKSYDHAIETGAMPIKPPHLMPWGQTISYVRDCNGFLVEICSKI